MMRRALALAALLALVAVPARAVRPGDRHEQMPERFGLRYEAVRFFTADSVALKGWWFPGPPLADAVVLAPRGEGTMANLLEAAKAFHDRGYSVLTFDYRDFGPGSAGPQDSLRYVVLASRWVTDMVGALGCARARADTNACVFAWGGPDLSTCVALAAAARDVRSCDGVAIEGLLRNTDEIMRWNGTAVIPEAVRQQRSKVKLRDEPGAAAARLKVPVLIVSGGRDSFTTASSSYAILANSRARHDRLLIPEGGHVGLERMPGYFDRVCAWFARMAGMLRGQPHP